ADLIANISTSWMRWWKKILRRRALVGIRFLWSWNLGGKMVLEVIRVISVYDDGID
ncbi:hypothetical protein PIB30_025593, partial [Stylosanthes scabra]|nr:hypothetical protein [Stylosanthes scabra]